MAESGIDILKRKTVQPQINSPSAAPSVIATATLRVTNNGDLRVTNTGDNRSVTLN